MMFSIVTTSLDVRLGCARDTDSRSSSWRSSAEMDKPYPDTPRLLDALMPSPPSVGSPSPAATLYPLKCLMRRVTRPVTGLRTVSSVGSESDSSKHALVAVGQYKILKNGSSDAWKSAKLST